MDKAKLKELQDVVSLLYHPNTARAINQDIATLQEAREGVTHEQRRDRLILAGKDDSVKNEMAAARLIKVTNDILAQNFALSFFELMTLADNEWPIIMNENIDKNFTVRYLGENGGQLKKQIVDRRTHIQLLMKTLATQEYEFPLYNVQTGRYDLMAKTEARLTYEMARKLDKVALALLDTAAIATGLRATLNMHPDIVQANLSDKNYFDLNGVGIAGKNGVEKMKQILDYCARFSSDTQDDLEGIQIKAIYMSSLNMRDFWDMTDLVAGYSLGSSVVNPQDTIPIEAKTQIYRSGKLEQMFGYPFAIVTRNTITSPYAYVSTNKPVGYFWQKPSLEQVLHNNSPEYQMLNKNSLWMKKVIQMAVTSEWTYRFMKVKF